MTFHKDETRRESKNKIRHRLGEGVGKPEEGVCMGGEGREGFMQDEELASIDYRVDYPRVSIDVRPGM